jgi:hypothetical protein
LKRKAIFVQAFPLERNVVVGYSEELDSESNWGMVWISSGFGA